MSSYKHLIEFEYDETYNDTDLIRDDVFDAFPEAKNLKITLIEKANG